MLSTELAQWVPCPITLDQVVFGGNGIVPNYPEPNFYLQRNPTLPQVAKGSINSIIAQVFVNRLN
jgi:hypothetical protein